MPSEAEVEAIVIAEDLNAPRCTTDNITETIEGEDYHVFNGVLTVCCLTLRNGFTVTGESGCASPENFNQKLGEKIAYDKARAKIFQLEGYLLKQRIFDGEITVL